MLRKTSLFCRKSLTSASKSLTFASKNLIFALLNLTFALLNLIFTSLKYTFMVSEEKRTFDFDDRMRLDDRMIVISLPMSDEPCF